ncbi:MAG: hypothetical protein GYA31_00270 [Parcubacteria group bacterium]|nr:hypothetical protein [Parcubacteria group bacterium]
MKKLILTISLITLLSGALLALAQPPEAPWIEIDPWGTNGVIKTITNWFFGIVLLIAVIMLIAAGFTYVTSAGNEEKVKSALNMLIYALIGVGIALLARGLVYLICVLFGKGAQCKFF